MSPALEVLSVSKVYRPEFGRAKVVALKDVSLEVRQGEVFALLGLNGAGKSTLVRIILDLVRPTQGKVLLFGEQGYTTKNIVGYLPESFGVPKGMTGRAVLGFVAQLSGMPGNRRKSALEETLKKVGLTDAAEWKVDSYSKGMVVRLGIAQALLSEPRIVFLDEPTDGLDPLGRKMIRDLIMKLSSEGVTVFLNSHLLSEIELVADRIAILHHGRVVISGILRELLPGDKSAKTGSTLEELFFAFLRDRDANNSHS